MSFTDNREDVVNLVEVLEQHPDKMFIGPEYMAVWSPVYGKALIIPGDYSQLTEEEANLLIIKMADILQPVG